MSDNGTQFTSEEFKIFLERNDIQHTRTPINHPATNGLAERYVGHMKEILKKIGKTGESLQSKIDRFLLSYRATPTHMGKSPSELLMNRQPRTRFNALRFSKTKEQVKVFQENLRQTPKFEVNDAVFAKNFGKGPNWVPGIIMDVLSPRSFIIQVNDAIWKRHVDQIKQRMLPKENKEVEEDKLERKENTECKSRSMNSLRKEEQLTKSNEHKSNEQQTQVIPQTDLDNTIDNKLEDKQDKAKFEGKKISGRERRVPKRLIMEC